MLGNRVMPVLLAAFLTGEALHAGIGLQFRTTAEMVEVPVVVLHRRQPVTNLTASDFTVLEDGKPVQITDVSIDRRPLEIALLQDVSVSTALPWIQAQSGLLAAAEGVSRLLRPDDSVRFYRFAEGIERVGTSSVSPVVPAGQTALFDAILQALLQKAESSRRLLIVLTDGLDTASSVPVEITRSVAARTETVVHVVVLSQQQGHWYFGEFGAGLRTIDEYFADLASVAVGSGGRLFDVDRPDRFLTAIAELLEQERTRYIVRYTPTTLSPGWHKLTVSTTNRQHQIRHRPGYWRPR